MRLHRVRSRTTEVAFTGWRASTPGDRAVKKELRGVLKQFALPVKGELFDRGFLYMEQLSIPVDQDLLRGLLRGRFVVGAFDELAVLELRAGADQCHEMGCVDRPPA